LIEDWRLKIGVWKVGIADWRIITSVPFIKSQIPFLGKNERSILRGLNERYTRDNRKSIER
jgi:hypothetical protein